MNRRKARHMSRRALAGGYVPATPVATPGPYPQTVGYLLKSFADSGFRLQHNAFMDESPPERETFSGGVIVSARVRNIERLRYQIAPAARTIYCGRYAYEFINATAAKRVGAVGTNSPGAT